MTDKQKILQHLMAGPKDTEQESMIRQSNLTQETKINITQFRGFGKVGRRLVKSEGENELREI